MENKSYKSFIEELKQRNNIVEVAKELIPGIKKVGAHWVGTIRGEKTPALTIYPATQSWCHFAGDKTPSGKGGGDVISLIEYINHCSFREAIELLAKRVGMEVKKMTPEEQKQLEESKKIEEQEQLILEKLVSVFEQGQAKAIEYLDTRNITNNDIITSYHLGWADFSVENLKKELTDFDQRVVAEILHNSYFFKNSLIIPVYQNGKIVTLYSRSDTREPKYKHLYLGGHPKGIFNYNEALNASSDKLYIAEAPINVLSALQNGITNIISTGGCKVGENQKQVIERLSDSLVTCFDNDESEKENSGLEATKNFLNEFSNAKMKVLPPGDLNDFFRKHNKEDFDRLEEIGILDVLLKEIPSDTPKDKLPELLEPFLKKLALENPARIRAVISSNKKRFDWDVKDVDSYVQTINKFSKELKSVEQNKLVEKEIKVEEKEIFSPEIIKDAEEILKSPTLLFDALKAVHKCGIAGEEKNILTHYLSLTSRLLESPISITVKGDSSAGKSFVLGKVLKLFSKSAYIDITDATAQSFYYTSKDYFKNRIIVIFEKHGGEKTDYAIRSLQSEGKLKIQTTIKNPKTNEFESKEIEREGPTGFITTTTDAMIHAENETRNVSIFPDQSQKQTNDIYNVINAKYLGVKKLSNEILKPWQCAQTLFEQLPVYIPFVENLGKYFPSKILRTRRDYSHFIAFIETSAFFHQKQRGREDVHETTYIRATLADYEIARIIIEDSLSKSIYELPPKTIELISVAKKLLASESDKTFNITILAKKIGWDRDTVAKWMKPGSKKGYFTITQESKGSKGAEYKVEEKDVPGDSFLPKVSILAKENPQETIQGIYNPITGQVIDLNQDCTDAQTDSEKQQNTLVKESTPVKPIGASVENTKTTEDWKTKIYYPNLDEFTDYLRPDQEPPRVDNSDTPPLTPQDEPTDQEGLPF